MQAMQVFSSPCSAVFRLCMCCGVLVFTGSHQKWQRTGDSWKGKYTQGSYHKDTATFKGKCNKCGQYGHKSNECSVAAQTP